MSQIKLPFPYEWIHDVFQGPDSSVSLVYNPERKKMYLAKALGDSSNWRRNLNTQNRIKKEIDFVSTFDHPHISKLEDSHYNQNTYVLFYPYSEGRTLQQALKDGRSFSLEETIAVLSQLLSALDYIHSRGVVHCDVNPNNIYLRSDGKIELFDFGLGLTEKEWKDVAVKLVGTPPYLAPEQAGLTEHKIDGRTDLYCAGLLMYRLLAGRLPHKMRGKELSEYMRDVLKRELPRVPDLPGRWNRVLAKALALDPDRRYQTAAGFRHDLEHPGERTGARDQWLALRRRSHFISRKVELGILRTHWKNAKGGAKGSRGGNVLLYGKSGVGKTELLREFQSELMQKGEACLSVKCNRFTPNHPLSVYRELMGATIHRLTETPENSARLKTALNRDFSRHSGLLCGVFPELKPLFREIIEAPQISPDALKDRQQFVLVSFLKTLLQFRSLPSLKARPGGDGLGGIFIDDLQWMDTSSFQALEEVVREKDSGFFVFLFRTEADLPVRGAQTGGETPVREGAPHLNALTKSFFAKDFFDAVLEIKPFSREDVSAFFQRHLGAVENEGELVDAVTRRTDCTPLTLKETLQHLLPSQGGTNSGLKQNREGAWVFSGDGLQGLTASELYARRFGKLPDRDKNFLRILSLLQGSLDGETIQGALNLSRETFQTRVEALMRHGFLKETADGHLEFPHDKLQEVIEAGLSREETVKINLLWGEYFEKQVSRTPRAVYPAYQYYRQAGQLQKEFEFACHAAAYSFDSFSYIEAKNYYGACLRMLKENRRLKIPEATGFHASGGTGVYQLQKRLAETLIILGDNDEALTYLLELVGKAGGQSQGEYLDVHAKIGSVYTKKSEFEKAAYHFEICMKGVKVRIPKSKWLLVFGILWEGLVFLLVRRAYNNREPDPRDRFKIDVINKQAYALFYTNLAACIYLGFKAGRNLCKSKWSSPETCIGLTQTTVVFYSIGLKKTAGSLARSTEGKLDQVNHPEAYSHSCGMLAMLYHYHGDWSSCIRIAQNGIKKSKNFGTKWARILAAEYLCLTYLRLGHLAALDIALKNYLKDTESGTDTHFYHKALCLARLRAHFTGQPYPDFDVQALKQHLLASPLPVLKLVNSARIIPTLELHDAYRFGENILNQIKHRYFSHEFLADLLLAHLNTLVQMLWADPGPASQAHLKKFRSYLLPCITKALIFKAHSGPACNATAWYCYFKGWQRLSHSFFRKAIRRNHSLDMRLEEARSHRDYAAVLEKQGLKEKATSHYLSAYQLYRRCGAHALAESLASRLSDARPGLGTSRSLSNAPPGTSFPDSPPATEATKEEVATTESTTAEATKEEATRTLYTLYTHSEAIRFDELYRLSQSISEFRDRGTLLKQILKAFIKGSHAQEGYLETFPGKGEDLKDKDPGADPVRIHINAKDEIQYQRPPHLNSKVVGWVREKGLPYRLRLSGEGVGPELSARQDRTSEPSARQDRTSEPSLDGEPFSLKNLSLKTSSLLCFPLMRGNDVTGFVYLIHRDLAGLFTPHTEKTCDIISAQTLLLLESHSLLNRKLKLKEKLKEKVRLQTENIHRQNRELEASNRELVKYENWRDSLLEASVLQLKSHESGLHRGINGVLVPETGGRNPRFHLQLAKLACRDMGILANNLSDVSRMDGGKFPLDKKKISHHALHQLIQRASIHPAFEQKNIRVRPDFTPNGFHLSWDPYLLERVFQNLTVNAAKYTPKNGVVQIRTAFRDGNLRVSLFNSGEPIPADAVEKIFRRYNRIDEKPSPYSKGLGLFFCHLACRAHHCRIWMEPVKDGNYFHLSIPAEKNTVGKFLERSPLKASQV